MTRAAQARRARELVDQGVPHRMVAVICGLDSDQAVREAVREARVADSQDPELTAAHRAYLAAFDKWLRQPTALNFLARRRAVARLLEDTTTVEEAA